MLAGLAVVIAGLAIALRPKPPLTRFTVERFYQLEPGMTRPQIVEILGQPLDLQTASPTPRDFRNWEDLASWSDQAQPVDDLWAAGMSGEEWIDENGGIIVIFDRSGGAVEAIVGVRRTEYGYSPADIRWRMKQQWHRWFP